MRRPLMHPSSFQRPQLPMSSPLPEALVICPPEGDLGDWSLLAGGYEAAPVTEETSILISHASWNVEGYVL